jgi:hypothetical protein
MKKTDENVKTAADAAKTETTTVNDARAGERAASLDQAIAADVNATTEGKRLEEARAAAEAKADPGDTRAADAYNAAKGKTAAALAEPTAGAAAAPSNWPPNSPVHVEPATTTTEDTGYRVAKGRSITTRRGLLDEGQAIRAKDLTGGQASLDELVANGAVERTGGGGTDTATRTATASQEPAGAPRTATPTTTTPTTAATAPTEPAPGERKSSR